MPNIYGSLVDNKTRCIHWHTEKDIIAIKFYCCGKYYPCYSCHEEHEDHPITVWPREKFNELAILCGECKQQLTINQYLSSGSVCPNCNANFNPGCSLHYHLYFEK